jgi:hypothetical protein
VLVYYSPGKILNVLKANTIEEGDTLCSDEDFIEDFISGHQPPSCSSGGSRIS